MQLFMKTCVVAVFLKRHVRTWYCNRCMYCVNSYVLSSVLISCKKNKQKKTTTTTTTTTLQQKESFSKIMYKNVYLWNIGTYAFMSSLFRFCFFVTIPKLALLCSPANMFVCLFNDLSCWVITDHTEQRHMSVYKGSLWFYLFLL